MICVTVIVPFYNVEQYFREFLNSLLPLNDDMEVLLVNDGSIDSSREIAKEFVEKFSNVFLLEKENGGLSSARNFGLGESKGEFVIFFDSDDYIEDSNTISNMYLKAKSNKSDIVVSPYYEFSDLDFKKYRYDKVAFEDDLVNLNDKLDVFFRNSVSFAVWNKLFRREFLDNFDLRFKEGIWFEDLEFIFRAFYYANRICKCDQVLLGYRQRLGSIMKTVSPKILNKMDVLDDLIVFLQEKGQRLEYYERFKVLYLRMAFSVIYTIASSGSNIDEQKDLLAKAFNYPLFKKILSEKLLCSSYMSKKELLFYYLVKFNVLNAGSLTLLSKFLK